MKPIEPNDVQRVIDGFANKDIYLHLETTNGAYATHNNEDFFFQRVLTYVTRWCAISMEKSLETAPIALA